jgi:class 3 adenylate cyclase
MTKDSGHMVFIAESTRAMLTREDGLVEVGEREVRGREEPIRIWSLA